MRLLELQVGNVDACCELTVPSQLHVLVLCIHMLPVRALVGKEAS